MRRVVPRLTLPVRRVAVVYPHAPRHRRRWASTSTPSVGKNNNGNDGAAEDCGGGDRVSSSRSPIEAMAQLVAAATPAAVASSAASAFPGWSLSPGAQSRKRQASEAASAPEGDCANADSAKPTIHLAESLQKYLDIDEFATGGGDKSVRWIDICSKEESERVDPALCQEAMRRVLHGHGIHETLISDAMEPVLLPQSVVIGDCACLILRCMVDNVPPVLRRTRAGDDGFGGKSRVLQLENNPKATDAESLQVLTARVTIFIHPKKVVTLHRTKLKWLESVKKRCADGHPPNGKFHLVNVLAKNCARTFDDELARAIIDFDLLETKLFSRQVKDRSDLAQSMYVIKRRAAVCFRAVHMAESAYAHTAATLGVRLGNRHFVDVSQHLAHVRHLSEELKDNATNVLALLFQLSSFQLNELMRVLTLFSAFFIPLGFIASFYGMNFDSMPLVHAEYGAEIAFGAMLFVAFALAAFLKYRGLIF